MIRLFIAFQIEEAVKQHLAEIINQFKPLTTDVKWVDPVNMHLTARFLGETDPKLIQQITAVIDTTCQNFGPIKGTVDRLGGFPSLTNPKVIWTGLSGKTELISTIVSKLNSNLTAFGIKSDNKRFKAHLTLGRVKKHDHLERLSNAMERFQFTPIAITFDRLELIQSTLTPRGPIYKVLGGTKLVERFG